MIRNYQNRWATLKKNKVLEIKITENQLKKEFVNSKIC